MRPDLRRLRGQSTVEFALMIPVMITIFFWIIEANVYLTSLHVTGYAAYASARSFIVCDPQEQHLGGFYNGPASAYGSGTADCADWVNVETKTPLLSGTIYPQNGGPNGSWNTLTLDKMQGTSYSAETADGVTITMADFAQMPYTRFLLSYGANGETPPTVPTHLGPSGFDPHFLADPRYPDGTADTLTDNNQDDSLPTPSGSLHGNGRGGPGHHGNNGNGNGNGNGNHNGNQNGFGNGFGNGHGNGGG